MKMLLLDRQPVGSGPAADLAIRRERGLFSEGAFGGSVTRRTPVTQSGLGLADRF